MNGSKPICAQPTPSANRARGNAFSREADSTHSVSELFAAMKLNVSDTTINSSIISIPDGETGAVILDETNLNASELAIGQKVL